MVQAKSGRNDGMLSAHLLGRSVHRVSGGLLLRLLLGACLLVCVPGAEADAPQAQPTKSQAGGSSTAQHLASPHVVARSQFGERYYALRFGVDQMRVRYTASGASVEFRYRVVDPDKAAVLSDKHATPYMIDEQTGIKLLVPVAEQIGALRQTAPPEQWREYWLLFANAGKVVKPGQRVDVSIGSFHVRGLTVE
jgi:hypothetical protein